MALIVQKYGGTSVANIDKIRFVAGNVIKTKERGNDVIAVVSAMAGETDRLINL
ncbi:MAG TPA: aspartate kinase, partial [Thermodesulfobacteriota bacterium]|nr:aspartate kinase [Thermodesulfobacteriota bacterium]